jgi:methionyl-tRNA synthetase
MDLSKKLNVKFDIFQRGSDQENHFKSSQKLWSLCNTNGDIYKKTYKGLYCVGCEQFYTQEELTENLECYEHPGKKLEEVEEENYFFRLSKYHKQISEIIHSNKIEIIPNNRKNEILKFLEKPLQDISISRSNERAKNWGVPVPNDNTQRIYVWFDALNIYQSGIGFGWDEKKYNDWWPADLHVIGKGILRFHAIYWPAFLISSKLQLPKKIFVHDYLTVNGQKMSKTLGNVLDPNPLVDLISTDGIRYYLLAKISPFNDGDVSVEKIKDTYNFELANGLGNLVARVAKLCEQNNILGTKTDNKFHPEIEKSLNEFKFNEALSIIWKQISQADKFINKERPWEQEGEKLKNNLENLVRQMSQIAFNLQPFLPETAEKILKQFSSNQIKSEEPLFPRIS